MFSILGYTWNKYTLISCIELLLHLMLIRKKSHFTKIWSNSSYLILTSWSMDTVTSALHYFKQRSDKIFMNKFLRLIMRNKGLIFVPKLLKCLL